LTVQLQQMKSTLLVFALTFAAIPFSVAQTPSGSPIYSLYELYSWRQSNGIWNFCLLPSPSGVNIRAETIFNKKLRLTGLPQLKRKISELPTGTRIIWMNGIAAGETPTPESRKLALPPIQTVEQVKRYAGAHGMQMETPSSSPD
jgi:hypothetical protein